MKFKVGDRVKIVNDNHWSPNVKIGYVGTIIGLDTAEERYAVKFDHYDIESFHTCDGLCPDGYGFWCDEEMLEQATKFKAGDKVRVLDGSTIENYTGDWTTFMCDDIGKVFTIERAENFFGERIGYLVKENPRIYDERGLEFASVSDVLNSFANEWRKLGQTIIPKEDKPMKLTFFTTEGYRIDKSNNTKIPTITTKVDCIFGDLIQSGSATCDKFNYDERQGVIEAVANALFRGKFDREYNRAVKANKEYEKVTRTCYYCGKVFDTIEERQAHEVWHVERRKARHERYLLRKRAKEIAFEEQAQKMAKEMLAEDNKK